MTRLEITFLGTSGALPTKERSLPSVALVREGDVFLFDCGEGTQIQLLKYGINSSKVKAIFISHAHGDHVIGIAGLLRTFALNGRQKELTICVPKGHENVVKALITFDRAMMGYPIIIKAVKGGLVYKGAGFTVSSFRMNHTIAAYGYIFKEDDKRRFMKDRCKRLGLKGTMFSELQKKGRIKVGNRSVALNDVTTFQPGEKIVYASDTRPTASTVNAAKGADLLIHESTYSESESALAKERGHSTAREAATVAKRARAKKLILTHISARYRTSDRLAKEARRIFKETVVASDGYNIVVG